MEIIMKVNIKMEKGMEKVFILLQMELITKADLKMEKITSLIIPSKVKSPFINSYLAIIKSKQKIIRLRWQFLIKS